MTDKFKLILKTFVDFNEKEIDYVVSFFKPKTVKKNSILLHEGNICREFYFKNEGCIRTISVIKSVSKLLSSKRETKSLLTYFLSIFSSEIFSIAQMIFFNYNSK